MARHLSSKAHGKRKAVGGLAAVVMAATVMAALVPSASAIVQPPDIGSATWNATWDPAAAWPPAADPGAWPVPATNPNLTPRCGLDFGVIVDRSGSIFDAGQATAYRDGLNSLIDAFADTPSNLGLWSFATDASDTDAVTYPWHQMADLSDPTNVESLHDTVNSIPVQTGFTTSWEEGLRAPLQASVDASPEPELWVVVTDGQPTVHADDNGTGLITNNDDMAGGIASANLLKASDGGTKVLAVGVGPGVSEAGLQLISGPTEFDPAAGNFVTADYITTSFADLASNLEDFALRLCGSSVTVTKEVSTVAAPTTYAAAPGWTFTATNDTAPPAVTPASDVTDDSGQVEFTWTSLVAETVTITETQMASFQLTSRTCTLGGEAFPFTETADGVQLTLTQGQHVSCTFRNQPAFIDLAVAKTDGKTTTEPGATNSYVITATNAPDATATATDVILTETVPDNATYEATGSAAWSCADESVAGTVCTINVGSLAPGASANRTFNVEVVDPVGAGVSDITNTVTVTGTGNERDTGDQTATDVDTLTAAPDLTVVKDDGGVTAEPGDEVTYAIDYANVGDRDATGVVLTETVPAGSTFVGPDGWTCVDTTCTFEVGDLAAGDSGSVDFTVLVNDPFPEGQTELDNIVVIGDDGENGDDPTPENNTDDDQTPVDVSEVSSNEDDPPVAVAGNVVLPVTGQEVNGLLALAGVLLILGGVAATASPAVAKRRRG